jgi:LCP family protein required for cell wall assembly
MGKHSKSGGLFDAPGDKNSHRPPARRRAPGRVADGHPLPPSGAARPRREKLSDPASRRTGSLESAPERLRAERDRRRRRVKRIMLFVAAALVFVVAAGAVGIFAYAKHIEATMQRTVYKTEKLEIDLKKAEPQKPYTMLIMGFDKRPKETVYRSDTIIFARIDPQTKEVWLLSIPRDTKVLIPGHGYNKMNAAYALGREELAVKTVERFTGMPINHFMAVNFDGFEKAVDAMGGVWVDVPMAINDPEADRSKGDKNAKLDKGYQLLDGAHALTLVRTRHFYADQDFGRMRTQQAFFRAVADQVSTKTSVAKIPAIVSAVAPYVTTDMSLMDMLRTAQALRGAGSKRVYTETFAGTWRSPYVYTDEVVKEKLLAKLQAGKPFKTPKKKKSKEASATVDATASTPQPSDVTVTVRNGAGIAGCAKQASSILKAQGYEVVDVGNAGQFVYKNTTIVYKKNAAVAEQLARALPPGAKIVESRGMYSFDSDVLVVIGKDWDISRVPVAPITTQ